MPTDDERRRVAERLRDLEKHAIPDARISYNPMTAEFIAAAVFYDLPYMRGLFSRLADLIEPSCDRDALLALADAMDGHADEMHDGCNFASSGDMRDYARRIREACGEVG